MLEQILACLILVFNGCMESNWSVWEIEYYQAVCMYDEC